MHKTARITRGQMLIRDLGAHGQRKIAGLRLKAYGQPEQPAEGGLKLQGQPEQSAAATGKPLPADVELDELLVRLAPAANAGAQ